MNFSVTMQPLTEQELATEIEAARNRLREAQLQALELRNERWAMLEAALQEELDAIDSQTNAELSARNTGPAINTETSPTDHRPCRQAYATALHEARPNLIEAIARAQAQITEATERHRQRVRSLDTRFNKRVSIGARLTYVEYEALRLESSALLEAETAAITEAFQQSWETYVEATGSHRQAALSESRAFNEAAGEPEQVLSDDQTTAILRKRDEAIRAAHDRHQKCRDRQHSLLRASNEAADARFQAEVIELNRRVIRQ